MQSLDCAQDSWSFVGFFSIALQRHVFIQINKLQGVSVDECSCYLPQLTTYSAHSQAQSAGWNCSSSFSLTYYSFFFSDIQSQQRLPPIERFCLLMLRTWITVNWKSHPLPDKHGELNRAVTGRWRSTVTVRATLFFYKSTICLRISNIVINLVYIHTFFLNPLVFFFQISLSRNRSKVQSWINFLA